jgi:hypothetical protein
MDKDFSFTPKSNSKLKPGHFWTIQLENGDFGCGIVLDVPSDNKENGTKSFYLGLLDWTSKITPTVESLESTSLTILKQGHAHVKTISIQGQQILGIIDLKKNNLEIDLVVDSQVYSNSSYVLKGFQIIRKATRQDHETLKTKSTWGYAVIINLANRLLTK